MSKIEIQYNDLKELDLHDSIVNEIIFSFENELLEFHISKYNEATRDYDEIILTFTSISNININNFQINKFQERDIFSTKFKLLQDEDRISIEIKIIFSGENEGRIPTYFNFDFYKCFIDIVTVIRDELSLKK